MPPKQLKVQSKKYQQWVKKRKRFKAKCIEMQNIRKKKKRVPKLGRKEKKKRNIKKSWKEVKNINSL